MASAQIETRPRQGAREISRYKRHWAHRFGIAPFLPMSREEMDEPPARLNRYDYTWREAPDSEQLLGYLVGVLIRLDRSQQYEDLVERVIEVGEGAVAALREVLAQLGTGQVHRQVIRQGALRALQMIAGSRVE